MHSFSIGDLSFTKRDIRLSDTWKIVKVSRTHKLYTLSTFTQLDCSLLSSFSFWSGNSLQNDCFGSNNSARYNFYEFVLDRTSKQFYSNDKIVYFIFYLVKLISSHFKFTMHSIQWHSYEVTGGTGGTLLITSFGKTPNRPNPWSSYNNIITDKCMHVI